MKLKKLLVSLASVLSLASICMVTTYAADARIELDTERTTETNKVIKVYCGDIPGGIWGGNVTLSFAPTNADDELVITKAWFDQEQDNHPADMTNDTQRWNATNKTYVEQVTYWGAETYTGDWFGTYVITVPEGTPAFTVTATCDFSDENYGSVPKTLVANIPGAGPTTVPFESATAEYIDTIADDADALPVAAWFATIDWSKYDEVKALNWELTVGGETKTVPESSETVVTGEMTVVYGLAIAGQATQLETIDKDNVVLK